MDVFLAWHEYERDNCDEAKLLGVFSTRALAEAAIEVRRMKPGFIDYPDGFEVSIRTVDDDSEWAEGFVKWADSLEP